jgi:hypothetical protein
MRSYKLQTITSMWIKLSLWSALALVCCQGYGQGLDKTNGAFLIGGFYASQVSGDQLAGFHQAGLNMGIGLRIPLRKVFVEQSIAFVQKGSRKIQDSDRGDYSTYNLRLNYLAYHLSIGQQFKRISYSAGGQLCYLISSKEGDQNGEYSLVRPFKSFDFSLFIDVEYQMHNNWGLSLGIGQGVIPVREHASGQTFRLNRGQYNSTIRTALRYYFGGKN